MKKYKLIEQAVEGDEEPKKETTVDNGDLLKKMRDTYKCSFLQGGIVKGAVGEMGPHVERVANKDSKSPGVFTAGDTLYIMPDFTFHVYTKGGTSPDGKKIKKVFKKDAGKWACAAYQKEGMSAIEDKQALTKIQQDEINKITDPNNPNYAGYVKSCDTRDIADGNCKQVDLSKIAGSIFKEPNKYFVYQRVGFSNKVSGTSDAESVKKRLTDLGWLIQKPEAADMYRYTEVDLYKNPKYPQYANVFSKTTRMWAPIDPSKFGNQEVETALSQARDDYKSQKVDRGQCKTTIDLLYDFAKKGMKMDPLKAQPARDLIKMCVRQLNFSNPFVNKKIEFLSKLPKENIFSLNESSKPSLKSLIHENLVEIANKKKRSIIEGRIIENRLKFIFENYEKDQNKDKLFRAIIHEFDYLHKQGFDENSLNEGVLGQELFSFLFGRMGGGGVDQFIEWFVQGLLAGLGLPRESFWSKLIAISFANIEREDLGKLFRMDCDYVTSMISKSFVEAGIQSMVNAKTPAGDFISGWIRNSIDSWFRSTFEDDFQMFLKDKVCPILAKFLTNKTEVENKLETKMLS